MVVLLVVSHCQHSNTHTHAERERERERFWNIFLRLLGKKFDDLALSGLKQIIKREFVGKRIFFVSFSL